MDKKYDLEAFLEWSESMMSFSALGRAAIGIYSTLGWQLH